MLDTGTINVLPYFVGIELGCIWERQTTSLNLTSNLVQYEARILLLQIAIAFEPVQFVFARTKAENVPLILGQVNFFREFDVCFHRSQPYFEVCPQAGVL